MIYMASTGAVSARIHGTEKRADDTIDVGYGGCMRSRREVNLLAHHLGPWEPCTLEADLDLLLQRGGW